jgi:hypothetical protein
MDKKELLDRIIWEFASQTSTMNHQERLIFIEDAILRNYKPELKGNDLSVLTEKYCEAVENELADEVYNKQWVKPNEQQILDAIKNAAAKIDEYQKKREAEEMNTPIMHYFAHDKNLGRQIRNMLLEFYHCIQDPDYFTKTYVKFSQK